MSQRGGKIIKDAFKLLVGIKTLILGGLSRMTLRAKG
jgi:hypothetical protein